MENEVVTTFQKERGKCHESCLDCLADITVWREMGLGEHWHYDEQGNKYFKGIVKREVK